MFETRNLKVIKATFGYIDDYYREFTDEICEYQYPDAFSSPEEAKELLGYFIDEMNQGNMLELMLLDKDDKFVGSMEAFGLKEDDIEVGLWLKKDSHGAGYGYEALCGLIAYLNRNYPRPYYIYEADERNTASVHLVNKLKNEKRGINNVTTESGKKLRLTVFRILNETKEM